MKIDKLRYWISEDLNPYKNQGLEEFLFWNAEPDECILYLWQNRNTVVIGKNQNARAEVRAGLLERDGGFLARRLSGGGAVYHDLGNLNFTFLVSRENYDLRTQSRVIQEMAKSFGIDAELTGRNDILADGRKFSGNAYYSSGNRCYHHGTIMINVDTGALGEYLNVSMDKLQSKGVASVKSRVVNLSELNGDITVSAVKNSMIEAFRKVYNLPASEVDRSEISSDRISPYAKKFASPAWKYGREFDFSFSIKDRYSWGGIEICPLVQDGKIEKCEIFSDSMDSSLISELSDALIGVDFSQDGIRRALAGFAGNIDGSEGLIFEENLEQVILDIEGLFERCF